MLTSTLTRTRLAHFQGAFFREVSKSPYKATLIVTTVGVANSALEAFVGSSPRTSTRHEIPCLYQKNVQATERKKYGFSDDVTGIVYASPLSLVPLLGTYKIDALKTQVEFFGHTDNIESVSYDEELYDTCVAVVIGLRSAATGA